MDGSEPGQKLSRRDMLKMIGATAAAGALAAVAPRPTEAAASASPVKVKTEVAPPPPEEIFAKERNQYYILRAGDTAWFSPLEIPAPTGEAADRIEMFNSFHEWTGPQRDIRVCPQVLFDALPKGQEYSKMTRVWIGPTFSHVPFQEVTLDPFEEGPKGEERWEGWGIGMSVRTQEKGDRRHPFSPSEIASAFTVYGFISSQRREAWRERNGEELYPREEGRKDMAESLARVALIGSSQLNFDQYQARAAEFTREVRIDDLKPAGLNEDEFEAIKEEIIKAGATRLPIEILDADRSSQYREPAKG